MCHVASSVLLQGKNVLYITLEMLRKRLQKELMLIFLNIPVQQLTDIPRQMFETKVTKLSEKTKGNLIIKEYPTLAAH